MKGDFPNLAIIENRLRFEPRLGGDPIMVEPDLFREAKAEMAEIMRARGFSVPRSPTIPVDNFILYGVTVIKHG